jgi:hypothetical protein
MICWLVSWKDDLLTCMCPERMICWPADLCPERMIMLTYWLDLLREGCGLWFADLLAHILREGWSADLLTRVFFGFMMDLLVWAPIFVLNFLPRIIIVVDLAGTYWMLAPGPILYLCTSLNSYSLALTRYSLLLPYTPIAFTLYTHTSLTLSLNTLWNPPLTHIPL